MILNFKASIKIFGVVTVIIGIAMFVPMCVSLCFGEYAVAKAFLVCALPLIAAGMLAVLLVPRTDINSLSLRDGFFIVVVCWVMVSVWGAFPFMVSGDIPNFIDAFFESASGYTTTGSTLLFDVEVLSKGCLFWRSFNHWLGGMGIILMTLVMLPMLGSGGSRLVKAEATGPIYESGDFSARKSSWKLYIVYLVVTVLMYVMLRFGGLHPFDAAVHMFGALGTGGFSCFNTSIGTYDSAYVDYVTSFFMLVCSINFTLVVYACSGKMKKALLDAELLLFNGIVVASTIFVTVMLWKSGTYKDFAQSLRYGFFHVCSLASSSGYSTDTVGPWPVPCKIVLFFLMIIGGCAASTSGGIKVIRLLLLFKIFKRSLQEKRHPGLVCNVALNGRVLSPDTQKNVLSYCICYAAAAVIATVLLSFDGIDLHTSIATCVSSLSNIGPDYWFDGRVMCFGLLSPLGKLLNVALMFLGRLEFLSIAMLFSRSFRDRV
ncbi:MAG: TrkH family potassium uptake protein [Eubacteriales bacterium]|nr:TrkH family potassium uptake protein [Eubacteriales bacterium]